MTEHFYTPEVNTFVLVRTVTYAALFIGLVLIYLPGPTLRASSRNVPKH